MEKVNSAARFHETSQSKESQHGGVTVARDAGFLQLAFPRLSNKKL